MICSRLTHCNSGVMWPIDPGSMTQCRCHCITLCVCVCVWSRPQNTISCVLHMQPTIWHIKWRIYFFLFPSVFFRLVNVWWGTDFFGGSPTKQRTIRKNNRTKEYTTKWNSEKKTKKRSCKKSLGGGCKGPHTWSLNWKCKVNCIHIWCPGAD